MFIVFLVIQIILSVFLIAVILLQRQGTDGLSGIGGGNVGGNLLSSQTSSGILVKTTAILAVLFMCNSLYLAHLSVGTHQKPSVIDSLKEDIKQIHDDLENTLKQNK